MNLKKTEYCRECQRDVYLNWNAEKDGYWCYCPYCGKKIMLCHYCMYIEGADNCDRDGYGNCKHSSENRIRNIDEMHKPIGRRDISSLTKDQRENEIDRLIALIDDCEDCIRACKIDIKNLNNDFEKNMLDSKRAEKGQRYYFINICAGQAFVNYTSDSRKKEDNWNYKYKNYFLVREQAEKICTTINEVIKNV